MMFNKHEQNPVIARTPDTFFSKYAANPDILDIDGKYYYYFRGQNDEDHDQIGVALSDRESFDGINWELYSDKPVIPVGKKDNFDSRHVLDPAAVVIDDKVFLYYSGHSYHKLACVGLAVAEDGLNFKKVDINPIIRNAIAPEVVKKDEQIYLFYQRSHEDGFFEIYCCPGDDGINFNTENEVKIFGPSHEDNTFDSFSISTVRIWHEGDYYYMAYGGNDTYKDYPCAIGLARSKNLFDWERYPGNPILTRGEPGSWDEGALWFATVFKHDDTFYMWYEGVGTGMAPDTPKGRKASRICRHQDYGGYGNISFSQIGLATYQGEMPDFKD